MRDYGKVYSAFWISPTTRALSDDALVLSLYLLTGPHGNLLGAFRLPDGYICDDLGWQTERVSEGFRNLSDNRFATRNEGNKWVIIEKYLTWNPIENPNQAKAASKLFDMLPDSDPRKPELARVLAESSRRFKEKLGDDFIAKFETLSKPFRNQEQEQEQEQDISAANASPPKTPVQVKRFKPPTLSEVQAYCSERGNSVSPKKFLAHYEANGWMRGKTKIKDWKACVRTWESDDEPKRRSEELV